MPGVERSVNARPLVVALVAVHNRLEYTKRCLAALQASAADCRLAIILVDDGSTDGTAEWLRSDASDVQVLRGDGTLWFGRSLQWALDEAKGRHPECDYIVTVNNDTFFRPGAIAEMIRASNGQASVGACFWIEDRQIPGSCGFVWHWLKGPQDFIVTDQYHQLSVAGSMEFCPVDLLATTATLFPARFAYQVAGIDLTRHPHTRADVCLTAQIRDAGSPQLVSTYFLADHLYGPMESRFTVRNLTIGQFFHATFVNRIGPAYLLGYLVSTWTTAPSKARAVPVILRRLYVFFRQIVAVMVLYLWRHIFLGSTESKPT